MQRAVYEERLREDTEDFAHGYEADKVRHPGRRLGEWTLRSDKLIIRLFRKRANALKIVQKHRQAGYCTRFIHRVEVPKCASSKLDLDGVKTERRCFCVAMKTHRVSKLSGYTETDSSGLIEANGDEVEVVAVKSYTLTYVSVPVVDL